MVKSELILRLAGRNEHLHRRDVEKVVDAVLEEIVAALARGDRVELRGFGSFSAKTREGRMGRNPKTGAPAPIPSRRVVLFKASPIVKQRINDARLQERSKKTVRETDMAGASQV